MVGVWHLWPIIIYSGHQGGRKLELDPFITTELPVIVAALLQSRSREDILPLLKLWIPIWPSFLGVQSVGLGFLLPT